MNKARPSSKHFLFQTDSGFGFDLVAFQKLLGPGVYMVSGVGGMLYIGSAKNILARIADETHLSFRQALTEAQGAWVSIILAKSEKHAREMEAYYISLHQPKYNKIGKGSTPSTYTGELDERWAEANFAADFERALTEKLA
jgi:excinuclease UvrABC nuclease subunit